MSTRGAVGFRLDGVDKITYNHSDSYPTGLGNRVCAFLAQWLNVNGVPHYDGPFPWAIDEHWRRIREEELRQKVRALRMVDADIPASPDDIARLRQYADPGVSTGQLSEWYVLLRRTHGNLDAIFAAGVVTDGSSFLHNSLFCEWAYIINLDSRELEIYRGFQKKRHKRGRYVRVEELVAQDLQGSRVTSFGTTYYPVALNCRFGFDALPAQLSDAITDNGFIKRPRRKGRVAA